MPRPFPFPINVGTDICSIARIFRLIAERDARVKERFVKKILTGRERERRWEAMSKKVDAWWDLQEQRRALGMGNGNYISKLRWDTRAAGSERALSKTRRPGGPRNKSVDNGHEDADLKPEYEGLRSSVVGNTTSADADTIESGASDESSIRPLGAALLRKSKGGKDDILVADLKTKVLEGRDELAREGLVKTASGAGRNSREKEEIDMKSRNLIEEIERLQPEIWNIARFAAKEATIKAYQTRRLTFEDIEIVSQPLLNGKTQAPVTMVISKEGDWNDAQIIPMSISHDGGYATATCLAYERSSGAAFETADDIANAIKPRKGKKS